MGGASQDSLPDAEIVEWKSFDGRMIPGILYRPAKRFTGPRPIMINVHGGPEARERPRALGRSNYFRNELGMAIIYPNIRGSIGYGKTYEHLDDGRNREDAVKDIGALLDWIGDTPRVRQEPRDADGRRATAATSRWRRRLPTAIASAARSRASV